LNADRNGSPFVEVRQVSKWFGDLQVLDKVTLEVPEHHVVCLIGASGSGKSTLLRCLNLLEHVQEGEIVVDGQPLTNGKVDVNALRRKIQPEEFDGNQPLALSVISAKHGPKRPRTNLMKNPKRSERFWSRRAGRFRVQ